MDKDSSASASSDVLRADPRARRVALVAATLVTAAVVAANLWLLPRLSVLALAGRISRKSICIGFLVVVILLVAPVVLAGSQNFRRGREAVRSRQFPTEGTRVLVDTPVKRGAQAVALGRTQQVLGAFLIVAGLLLLTVASFGVYTLW